MKAVLNEFKRTRLILHQWKRTLLHYQG